MSLTGHLVGFTVCLAVLMGYYYFFLEKESFHHAKRVFLLLAVGVSAAIPAITFPVYVQVADPILITPGQLLGTEQPGVEDVVVASPAHWVPKALLMVYLLGCVLLSFRFVKNMFSIVRRIIINEKQKEGKLRYVLLRNAIVPNAFLQYIFLNKTQYETRQIPREVLLHEAVHARQYHALDLIFIELIQVLLWFHPLVYPLKSAMKLNHEFLADRGVLACGGSTRVYQYVLLQYASRGSSTSLTNAFNFSRIKRRFTMMTKSSNKKVLFLKMALLVPMVSLLLYSFSAREIVVSDSKAIPEGSAISAPEEMQNPAEAYNQLAKYYNTYPEVDFLVKLRDMWKIKDLYTSIPEGDRAGLEKYPRSTTSLSIFISDDGKFLVDEKEVSLAWIASLLEGLSERERSNVYVFDSMGDHSKYGKLRRQMNRSVLPPNDVYISVFSEKLVEEQFPEFSANMKEGVREVNYADKNPALAAPLQKLQAVLREQAVKVDY